MSETFPELERVSKIIKNAQHKKISLFLSDNPDGIISGILLKKALKNFDSFVRVSLPPQFILTPKEIAALGYKPDLLFIVGKGSFSEYNELQPLAGEVVVIDNHTPAADYDKAIILNPNASGSCRCSVSTIVHKLLKHLEVNDIFDDFLNLVGLTGDFNLNTVTDDYTEFARNFVNESRQRYENLFEPDCEKATVFDLNQRKRSSLLHRITEFIHAVAGGGYQFFYKERDPRLHELDPPTYIFNQLDRLSESGVDPKSWDVLDDFICSLPNPEPGRLMYDFFLADWSHYQKLMDASVRLNKNETAENYFFCCENIKLGPMLATVKAHELKRESELTSILYILLNLTDKAAKFSFRSPGPNNKLFSDRLATALENKIRDADPSSAVSTTGYPDSAECYISSDLLPITSILTILFDLLPGNENLRKD